MDNSLLGQLGIDWGLLVSQAVNFFIILVVLTFFVYKPIMKIIKERNAKIKEGLDKAHEADVRLKEVDVIGKEKIKEAENKSIGIIKDTEKKAKVLEQELNKKLEENNLRLQKDLEASYKKQQEEAKELVLKNAVDLVKKTLIKTVELRPQDVDESLIRKAASQMNEQE